MKLFTITSLLFVSAAILFSLSSLSSAASTTDTTSSDVPSSQHEVHILRHHRRLNSKTSKALLFSKTSKAYHSSATQVSDTPASATQDTPDTSSSNNNNGSTNYYYHPNINKRFFMFSKGGKMFKSTKTLKKNHTSNDVPSTIDTSFPDIAAALSFSFSMSYDMSMSFDNNDGGNFFFLPNDVIQEFGREVSKSGKSSAYRASSKSKTSKL